METLELLWKLEFPQGVKNMLEVNNNNVLINFKKDRIIFKFENIFKQEPNFS